MSLLDFNCWPPSGSVLISCSTIKILNCYAALCLLICSLYRHQPEEEQVCYLETRGALNRRSIHGIIPFLLVIQSVRLQNTQSSIFFQGNHVSTESKSAFNSDNTSFLAYRKFKLVYSLARNSPLCLIEGQCFKDSSSDFSYHTNLIQFSAPVRLSQSNKGGATEYNNRNFARGYPTELFLIFSPPRLIKVRWFKPFHSDFVLSHKSDQIIPSWPP